LSDIKDLKIRPLDKSTWKDFELLFESKGILGNCWCMVWRMTKEEQKNNTSECRKKFMKTRVDEGIPVGLLAFEDKKAVAWCSIAPKSTHNSGLGGNTTLENVWSLTCFFVLPPYRKQGLTHLFIEEAKKYAKKNGASYIEAYPVEKNSPSYRHMGFVEIFEKEDFQHTGKTGTRRNVMLCELKQQS